MKALSRLILGGVCTALVVAAVTFSPAIAPTANGDDGRGGVNLAERKYKCTKCRQVFTFDRPGNYKCPNCGKPLIPAYQ
jgi:Zn finger protein HypA/HybF involved in hydrogenase expression